MALPSACGSRAGRQGAAATMAGSHQLGIAVLQACQPTCLCCLTVCLSPSHRRPSLLPQVDFHTDDPIEIIKRLMIGSEGTLGFVSQASRGTRVEQLRRHGDKLCGARVAAEVPSKARAAMLQQATRDPPPVGTNTSAPRPLLRRPPTTRCRSGRTRRPRLWCSLTSCPPARAPRVRGRGGWAVKWCTGCHVGCRPAVVSA